MDLTLWLVRMGRRMAEDGGERPTQEAHYRNEGKADRTGHRLVRGLLVVQHEYNVDEKETVRQNRRNTLRKAAWTAGRPGVGHSWTRLTSIVHCLCLVGRLGYLPGPSTCTGLGAAAAKDFIFLIVLFFSVTDENIAF